MKNKRGFTLVELLVVIAIIGVISILVLPNFIGKYNDSTEKAMKLQEQQIIDASKLFLEDVCIHPINPPELGMGCSDLSLDVKESGSNRKFVCLSTLQTLGYLDPIIFDGGECNGFVVYDREPNTKNYSNHKAYLNCGSDGYNTEGLKSMLDYSSNYITETCMIDIPSSGNPSGEPGGGGTPGGDSPGGGGGSGGNPTDPIDPDPDDPTNPTGSNYQNGSTLQTFGHLQDAINSLSSGQKVIVLQNYEEDQDALISESKDIKIDLNGKILTLNNSYINNSGKLDIYTSASGGILRGNGKEWHDSEGATEEGETGKKYYPLIVNTGTLTTNGTSNRNTLTIQNNRTTSIGRDIINFVGGTTTLNTNTLLNFEKKATSGSIRYVTSNYGIMYINGARIENYYSDDSGISNRGIVNYHTDARVILNSGYINVSTLGINNLYGTGGSGNPAVIIKGGTIKSVFKYAVYNQVAGAYMTMSGGNVISSKDGIANQGVFNFNGGTITANDRPLFNKSILNISGNAKASTLLTRKPGDVNNDGTVTNADATKLNGIIGNTSEFTDIDQMIASNVDMNDIIDINDFNIINDNVLGTKTLPYTTDDLNAIDCIYIPSTAEDNFELNITGGKLYGRMGIRSNKENGTINISGNTEIKGARYGIYDNKGDTINITGGKISNELSGSDYSAIVLRGTGNNVTINNATITGTSRGVYINQKSNVTIGGTTKISAESYGVLNYSSNSATGVNNLTINGGTITSNMYGIKNQGAGNLLITAGKISGSTIAVFNTSTATMTIGVNDGNVNYNDILIEGNQYNDSRGVVNNNTAGFNFYDGTLTSYSGAGKSYQTASGSTVSVPSGYVIDRQVSGGNENATLKPN